MRQRCTIDRLTRASEGGRPTTAAQAPVAELLDGVPVPAEPLSADEVAAVLHVASALDAAAHGLVVEVRAALVGGLYDLLRPEVTVRRVVPSHQRVPAPPATAALLAVLVGDDERATARRARRCGAAGVPEVWTITPAAGLGHRLTAPCGGVYTARDLLLPGERVAPLAAPWLEVVAIAAREARAGRYAERGP
jgi:hypothetical protein